MRFVVTFGLGDTERRDAYTVIDAPSLAAAHDEGWRRFGGRWSMVYHEVEGLGIARRWGLRYIEPPA